jgi:STE24 endopeptidase
LLLSRLPDRIGAVLTPRTRTWLIRVAFLAAVFLLLRIVRLPFLYLLFRFHEALGLTPMTALEWIRVLLLGFSIPLVLFVLKYLLVICTIPIFRQYWWLAAAVGVFLVMQVIPEVVSRTYRLDPVETVRPLEAGPHYDAMRAVLKKAGRDLSIMEVHHSRRSNTANIYLAGRPGREYVVVTDTFVRQYSPQEAALTLAHELGHLERRIPALLIEKSSALLTLLLTFGLARLLSRREPPHVSSALRLAVLVMLCSSLVSFAFSPVTNAVSRAEERIADRHALRLTGDLECFKQLLVKQAKHDLEMLEPPGWQYWLFATHPTVLERIALANGKQAHSRFHPKEDDR